MDSATATRLTPAGRIRKPLYGTLAQWVRDSWEEVDIHLIVKAFKCCGVSVKMDGTEDDVVFDYKLLIVLTAVMFGNVISDLKF